MDYVSPALFTAPFRWLGHNICAFAQREGCHSTVVVALKCDAPWGVDNFNSGSEPDLSVAVPAAVEAAARRFLLVVRRAWAPVMDGLRVIYPTLPDEARCAAHLSTLSAHRIVGLAQSQYAQVAFSAQLARAAVHECSAMRAGEAMAESFRNLPHSLAAWIRVFPPMIVLRRDDALLGTVPAAQFTAAYLRHKWWHRALDPAAPIHDASFLDAHRRQVVALIELDLPISVPELPAAVLTGKLRLGSRHLGGGSHGGP